MNTIDLCNLSLALVGVDRGIESLDDDEPAARYCRRLYPQVRGLMLRDHPWRWASRRVALAAMTDTVPEWEYVYGYPSDCVKLLAVEDEQPDQAIQYEHEVRSLGGSLVAVCCDVYQAYARYTMDVTDANLFDPAFVEALTSSLAAKLAISLTGDRQLAGALLQQYERALGRAKFLDASEGHREPHIGNRFIEARTA